jgi:hypothetical protein
MACYCWTETVLLLADESLPAVPYCGHSQLSQRLISTASSRLVLDLKSRLSLRAAVMSLRAAVISIHHHLMSLHHHLL